MHLQTPWSRCGLVALLATLAGCATSRANTHAARDEECHFTVVNRTGSPLAVRQFIGRSATEIGAINPNESVSATSPCAEGGAFVAGFPIPRQVGVPAQFGPVFAAVELVPGERTRVNLFWP
jgi:hypothetical protein